MTFIDASYGFNGLIAPVFIDTNVIAYVQGNASVVIHQHYYHQVASSTTSDNTCSATTSTITHHPEHEHIQRIVFPNCNTRSNDDEDEGENNGGGDILYLASDPSHNILVIAMRNKVFVYEIIQQSDLDSGCWVLRQLDVIQMVHQCLGIICNAGTVACLDCRCNETNINCVVLVVWNPVVEDVGRVSLSPLIIIDEKRDACLSYNAGRYFVGYHQKIVCVEVESENCRWLFKTQTMNLSFQSDQEVITSCVALKSTEDSSDITVCVGTNLGNIFLYFDDDFSMFSMIEADRDEINTMTVLQKGFAVGTASGNIQIYVALENNKGNYCCCKRWTIEDQDEPSISFLSSSYLQKVFLAVAGGANHLYWVEYDSEMRLLHEMSSDSIIIRQLNFRNHCLAQGHIEDIIGTDVCIGRPFLVTISLDQTLRIWNYELHLPVAYKRFLERLSGAISIHPSGLHLAIGFQDKLVVMHVLPNEVIEAFNIPIKASLIALFSHGGNRLAIADGADIIVYDVYSMKKLVVLHGHLGNVFQISWAPDDSSISTIGKEGAVYLWSMITFNRIGETSCTRNPLICVSADKGVAWIVEDGGKTLISAKLPDTILESHTADEDFKYGTIAWYSSGIFVSCYNNRTQKSHLICRQVTSEFHVLPNICSITAMCITSNEKYLYVVDKGGIITVVSMAKVDQKIKPQLVPQEDNMLVSQLSLKNMKDSALVLKEKINELNMQKEYQHRMTLKLREDKVRFMYCYNVVTQLIFT